MCARCIMFESGKTIYLLKYLPLNKVLSHNFLEIYNKKLLSIVILMCKRKKKKQYKSIPQLLNNYNLSHTGQYLPKRYLISSSLLPLITSILILTHIRSMFLDVTYEKYAVLVSLCLAYFTQHKDLQFILETYGSVVFLYIFYLSYIHMYICM